MKCYGLAVLHLDAGVTQTLNQKFSYIARFVSAGLTKLTRNRVHIIHGESTVLLQNELLHVMGISLFILGSEQLYSTKSTVAMAWIHSMQTLLLLPNGEQRKSLVYPRRWRIRPYSFVLSDIS